MWMENDACACHVTWFVGVSANGVLVFFFFFLGGGVGLGSKVYNPKMVNFTKKCLCVKCNSHNDQIWLKCYSEQNDSFGK
jgi:hypothetical protein